ncbi:MAG: vWA domain-containing protein, partial [Actinomycetota bacterium]
PRRLRPAPAGTRFDVRRTLRRSLRTHGEPFDRAWRARGNRSRPLVLILDVSGSMAPYARALLQFAFAAMAAGRRVEVFCFGTRLTRVTRTLRTTDPDRAMREVGRLVADWEGGTRIGQSLKSLLDEWSQRAALRGAVAVLCSDGLERGEPDLLRDQMARLRRLVHRIVWVNPLKGSPRYEPLARGMAAALPSIDVFLPGHNLESLEELSRVLGD